MHALITLALLAGLPTPSPDTKPLFDGSYVLYIENDTFSPAGDESYTQGLELQVGLGKSRKPLPFVDRFMDQLASSTRPFERQTSAVVGQTLFTPQNIVTYRPRTDDRPFVAHLYTGFAWTRTEPSFTRDPNCRWHRPRQFSSRLLLGVTGPMASGRTAQGAFHVLRGSRIPKGWYSQADNLPEITAMLMRQDGFPVFGLDPKHVNFTTLGRLTLGTLQDVVAAAGTLRIGGNLSSFAPTTIPERVGRSRSSRATEWAFFGAVEGRAYALNRLAAQGGARRPEFVPFQWEWRAGAYIRFADGYGVSYTLVRRSKEIDPLPPGLLEKHWVGSLQFSKTDGEGSPGGPDFTRAMAGTRIQLGLGRGESHVDANIPAEPSWSLSSHWGLERSIFRDRLVVGLETTGTVREHGPHTAEPEGHRDTFLRAKTAVLGVELLPPTSAHHLQLRAGGGLSSVKTQTIPVENRIAQPLIPDPVVDEGSSAMVGLRYVARLGAQVSLGLNFAYAHLFLDGENTGVRRARFWITTLTIQLHPWGRDRRDAPPRETDCGGLDPSQ